MTRNFREMESLSRSALGQQIYKPTNPQMTDSSPLSNVFVFFEICSDEESFIKQFLAEAEGKGEKLV